MGFGDFLQGLEEASHHARETGFARGSGDEARNKATVVSRSFTMPAPSRSDPPACLQENNNPEDGAPTEKKHKKHVAAEHLCKRCGAAFALRRTLDMHARSCSSVPQ